MYSGPVRRRLERAGLAGLSSGRWICLESGFRHPVLDRPLVGLGWLLQKQPSRFSDLLRFHKSSGGAVSLAQRSVLPSIPKSGLTTPCKDWEIWDWGLDWDRRPHVLISSRKRASLTSLCVCGVVPSPNSMTATVRNDSPRPIKVIIWH